MKYSKEARKNLLEERPGLNNASLYAAISVKWKVPYFEEQFSNSVFVLFNNFPFFFFFWLIS